MRNHLIQDYPHETQGILALFRDAEMMGKHMRFLDDRMRAASTMSLGECVRHGATMTRWVWPIRRFVSTPAAKGLTRYFRTRELLELFHSEGTLMSVLVPLGFAFTGNFQRPPQGGCGVMVNWFCRKIAADGGRICLGQRVKEVQVNRHKEATGVLLENGQVVQARYVVAACDVETLFGKMVPPSCIPERWRKRLRNADLFYSSFNIYLGLDCDPASLGLNEETVRLTDENLPLAKRVRGEARATSITLLSPSLRDSSLAPPGKGTLIIQCPAYLNYENNWQTGPGFERGEAYRRLKQTYADILLDRVERALIPDLRRHIEVMEVATPVTFWRYTGNRGGTIMGHKPTRKNIHAGVARVGTPIKRLLLGGQWAEYGGGVPMATKAAVNASLMILDDLRPPACKSLKEVVDGTAKAPLTIGIPRTLYYFYHPALWETFFRRLGLKVLVSEASTSRTIEQAALISESEHCLPLKLLDAHLAQLVDRVDMIFVPRILSTLKGHIACPKLGALPDVAIAQFGERTKVLTLDIHEGQVKLEQTLLELGRKLGAADTDTQKATTDALAAFRAALQQPTPPHDSTRKTFLILGHPYNLHDEFISGPILKKLQRLNINVELVSFAAETVPNGPIKWDTCSKMYHHLQMMEPTRYAAVVQLTSFNCGCDSIIMEFYREILKDKGVPYMPLVVDEHASQGGIDTRLEAFVDSTGWEK
jgi:prolycopene isomerase